MNKTIPAKTLWFFTGAALLIGLIALFYLTSTSGLITSTNEMRKIYSKINRVQHLGFLIKQAETCSRAHVIPGNDYCLTSYSKTKDAILRELELYKERFYSDQPESKLFLDYKALINKKIELNDSIISLAKTGKTREAVMLIASGEDQNIIDQTDSLGAVIITGEKEKLAAINTSFLGKSRKTIVLIITGNAITLILFFIGIFKISLELKRRRQLEDKLQKQNAVLASTNDLLQENNSQLEKANETIISLSEENLRSQANLFKMVIDNIPSPLLVFDRELNLQFVNESGAQKFEVKHDLSEPDTEKSGCLLETLKYHSSRVLEAKDIIESEMIVEVDGENRTFMTRFVPVKENNQITMVVMTSYEITERKKYEQRLLNLTEDLDKKVKERTAQLEDINTKLKESAEEIFDLYNNAPLGYYSINSDGEIIKANKTTLQLLGYNEDELLGKKIKDVLIPKKDHTLFDSSFAGVKRGKIVENIEAEFLKKDGCLLPVLLNVSFITDAEGNFLMSRSAFTDNTELRKARLEVEKWVEALQMVNKDLESFSYSISHDLRAPLRSINGFGKILKNDYHQVLDKEGNRFLEIILQNSNQMSQLIDGLLEFSKLGKKGMSKSSFSMEELIKEVLSSNHLLDKKSIQYISVESMPVVEGDRNLIRQVWINLISNAIKFSSRKEVPEIMISFQEDEKEFTFMIKDNGAGFDPRYKSKLFGVFQRLHSTEEFEGTGAGLAIIQRIIHAHNGKIWAESELDMGATFYFTLPKG